AVQAAREAARRAQCTNQLKQIGLAYANHEATHKFFPSGGWGGGWVGDPNEGVGRSQPGGWVFAILPFIEETQIASMGQGAATPQQRFSELARRDAQVVAALNCPTRRDAKAYPNTLNKKPVNAGVALAHARTDYAANAGTMSQIENFNAPTGGGPFKKEDLLDGTFKIPTSKCHDGVSINFSQMRVAQITDGTSKTYAVGERYIDPNHYEDGAHFANDWSMYSGLQNDTYRTAYFNAVSGAGYPVLPDTPGSDFSNSFGSAHPAGANFVFCDGSVQLVPFDVEPLVHWRAASRFDDGGTPDREYLQNGPTQRCVKVPF
ncbi:MAG: DUF1559 domain-containing protein, partial [Lacipirellulaceae bacterium]